MSSLLLQWFLNNQLNSTRKEGLRIVFLAFGFYSFHKQVQICVSNFEGVGHISMFELHAVINKKGFLNHG